MRKLLVLGLILGMASLATATPVALSLGDLSLSFSGTTFTVKGNFAKELAFGIYDDTNPDTGAFVTGSILPAAGGLGAMTKFDGYNGIDFQTQPNGLVAGNVVSAGNWFTFTYAGTVKTFNLYDESSNPAGDLIGTITATPEPATLVILGLGGLLLGRKKA
jgi:hypothetical protein